MASRAPPPDVVVPSAGRASLRRLLAALEPQRRDLGRVLVVDDRRPGAGTALDAPAWAEVVRGAGRGPAAARNRGWRAAAAEWVAFLDDDVVPPRGWAAELRHDLGGLAPAVAASQGQLTVPLPRDRRPTDWERNVAGLAGARWITADMALRRAALAAVGGFDERFRRAYREDTDLALRLLRGGWQIAQGQRRVEHPAPPAGLWASVRLQRGNADDALMRARHGRHWRRWGAAPRGRLRRHLLATGALAGAVAATATKRPRTGAGLGLAWLGLTAELAWARIAPGPRDRGELARMALTSAVLPAAASAWAAWGWLRLPFLLARGGPRGDGAAPPRSRPRAVLLDRDGTLLFDVPYNRDPARVAPLPGAADAVGRLRREGLATAVVSNQSGIGRGLLDEDEMRAVNRRAEELLGPLGPWFVCPHAPGERCGCRKPAPGLVLRAAASLGVSPDRCAVVGDVAADVQAAQAAGAAAVLVPTPRTEPEDLRRAPAVAATLGEAVERLLGGEPR